MMRTGPTPMPPSACSTTTAPARWKSSLDAPYELPEDYQPPPAAEARRSRRWSSGRWMIRPAACQSRRNWTRKSSNLELVRSGCGHFVQWEAARAVQPAMEDFCPAPRTDQPDHSPTRHADAHWRVGAIALFAAGPVPDMQFVAKRVAIGLEADPGERRIRGGPCACSSINAVIRVAFLGGQVLPDHRVHQHTRGALLRRAELSLDEVRGSHPRDLGRASVRRAIAASIRCDAFGKVGPDIGFEPQRLCWSVRSTGATSQPRASTMSKLLRAGAAIAAPFGHELHARCGRAGRHAAQIIAIAAHHQI